MVKVWKCFVQATSMHVLKQHCWSAALRTTVFAFSRFPACALLRSVLVGLAIETDFGKFYNLLIQIQRDVLVLNNVVLMRMC